MEERQFITTMEYIVAALKERGYDPHVQLTGYVTHNEPTYITSHTDYNFMDHHILGYIS